MSSVDVIIYVENFPELVGYLDLYAPGTLARDEDNKLIMPPVVTGFPRTPAVVNGDSLMAYMRLTEEQADTWRETPGVEVLAQAEYQGNGTGNVVYDALFADPDATAKYDSVYDRSPREVDDGEGGTITMTPPAKFGVMA